MKILLLLSLSFNLFAIDFKEIGDKYFLENKSMLNAIGSSIGIVHGGELVYFKGVGLRDRENNLPVEKTTPFRIGSITKTFTALAIMQLQERGLLEINEAAELYIPELSKLNYPYEGVRKITIRDLLTHKSGLIRHPQPEDQTITGLIEDLTTREDQFIYQYYNDSFYFPGYKYEYSNIGFALLGEIITRASGIPVKEYIAENILGPLEMFNTYWHEDDIPELIKGKAYNINPQTESFEVQSEWDLKGYSAAGSIYSSMEDMAKYASLNLLDHKTPNPVISSFTLHEMHSTQSDANQSGVNVGIAWHLLNLKDEFPSTGHNGATLSYLASLNLDREWGVAVIAFSNSTNASPTQYTTGLLTILTNEIHNEFVSSIYEMEELLISCFSGCEESQYKELFTQNMVDYFSSISGSVKELFISISIQLGQPLKIESIKFKEGNYKIKVKVDHPSREFSTYNIEFFDGKISNILIN